MICTTEKKLIPDKFSILWFISSLLKKSRKTNFYNTNNASMITTDWYNLFRTF